MKTLLIIPAYNEQENIGALLDELDTQYAEYDYVVVNDCSKDRTKEILKERGAAYLDLPINLGIGGGVQAGYMYALENGYDIAVQMDGDGQHLPAYLKAIVAPVENGEADFAVGSRFISHEGFQSSALRHCVSEQIVAAAGRCAGAGCDKRLSCRQPQGHCVVCG